MALKLLETKNLVKQYGGRRVVDELSISVGRSEIVGLLGPNGAGKTTTINILTGLVFKDSGNCIVFGKDTVNDYRFTRSKIGIAAQELSVDWFLALRTCYFSKQVIME